MSTTCSLKSSPSITTVESWNDDKFDVKLQSSAIIVSDDDVLGERLCKYFSSSTTATLDVSLSSTVPSEVPLYDAVVGVGYVQDEPLTSSAAPKNNGQCCRCFGGEETKADWWVLASVFLFNCLYGFHFSSYSVLFVWLEELFDTSRATVGWIQSIEFFLSAFLGILMSYPISIYGCRLTATLGSILLAVGGILSCFSPNIACMIIFKSVIPGIGLSMALLGSYVVIQQRFIKRRALANGVTAIGLTLGHVIGPPVIDAILQQYGARGTLALLGAIQANCIPLALQFRTPSSLVRHHVQTATNFEVDDNGHVTRLSSETVPTTCQNTSRCSSCKGCCQKGISYIRRSMDFHQLVRNAPYRIFCIVGMLHRFIYAGFIPQTVNWAMAAGVPSAEATWAVSSISIVSFVTHTLTTFIADKSWVNRFILFDCGLVLMTVGVVTPLLSPGVVSTFVSTSLLGCSNGICMTLLMVLVVDLVGVKNVARCLAMFHFLAAFTTLAATPITGMLYDKLHSYFAAFIMFGVTGLTAFCLHTYLVVIQRRKRRKELFVIAQLSRS